MAYISTEQVKEKRNAIKKLFPAKDGWKFSITKDNYTTINVYIMEAPVNFLAKYKNGFSVRNGTRETPRSIQQIHSICDSGNHDNSDIMTDYFDVGWYTYVYIGRWDKEFKFVKK